MPGTTLSAFNIPLLKKTNNLWSKLTGDPLKFSLESRIFHSISVGLTTLSFLYVPYNFYAGLYVGSLSALLMSVVFFYQYYNSRFRGKAHSNLLFGIMGPLIFSANYFSNSGIDGSTDIIWPVYLLLVFAITPYRQHLAWLAVYYLVFFAVHLIEARYPELILHPFVAGEGQFIDRVTAFPIPLVTIWIVINFMRKRYEQEQIIAKEKTEAVEVRNEQILLQKEQLEQSNAEKNKLMSIISHDMRAPLVNIQNYLELLKEFELEPEQRSELEAELLTTTTGTMQMLSNLLYWTKSQMEGVAVNLQELGLLAALQNTLDMEKTLAMKKGISLVYDIPEETKVYADADMLQLVIRNLINNSIKFTPQGGKISIDSVSNNSEVTITVRDNGKGISPEKQEGIFAVTRSASGTNNEKGTGLGLLLCKDFAKLQGGNIGFESTEGAGSSFYIVVKAASK